MTLVAPTPTRLDLGPDLDLRLVRYFTVVAEHLNFGRAAAALHVAQPSLSRQIQRLEDQLGVRLLDRTPQGSRLTEAGEAFLSQAHALLRAARHATATARSAVPSRAITIGYVGDLVVTSAVRDLRRRDPEARIRTRHLTWDDGIPALAACRVDALVTRMQMPFPADGLQVTVLYDEPRVLLVPASHPLAGKKSVAADDFADEPLVSCPSSATAWSAAAYTEPHLDDPPARPGSAVIPSYEDKLELLADGQAIAIFPAGDRRVTLREDLATIPITGMEPTQVVIATLANEDRPLIAAFRESARTSFAGRVMGTSGYRQTISQRS